ncbi:EAL domain-containing protein [Vibrio lamellibrachiae]|uniref:putative bifunctional diguanylate cyclase/phosphodiesterase n=1 Tax=Vibrio lamellibrachiae TaxID=2910253 RepID=UPI003D0DA53C
MQLSLKLNIIILPVMLLIFSMAGYITYIAQKQQLESVLDLKIKYELKHVAGTLNKSINALETLSNLFLDSDAINGYLNSLSVSKHSSYSNSRLTKYITSLDPSFGSVTQFSLVDLAGNELFIYDTKDPFASIELPEGFSEFFESVSSELKDQGLTKIDTSMYHYHTLESKRDEILLVKIFSPDVPIPSTNVSKTHRLYAAIFTVLLNPNEGSLSLQDSALKSNIELKLSSLGPSRTIYKNQHIDRQSTDESRYGFSLTSDLFHITISLPNEKLNDFYRPYKVIFTIIVSLVTLLSYMFLKVLIEKGVIGPIVDLTQQVELSTPGGVMTIKRSSDDDEVSTLANKYLDLIESLEAQAKYDTLTELANRNQFNLFLNSTLNTNVISNDRFAVLYFDIDKFKVVNDRFGHRVGDEILKSISSDLINILDSYKIPYGEDDKRLLARISGDEFAIIIQNVRGMRDIETISNEIINLFQGGYEIDDVVFDIGISIGASIYPDDAIDVEGLMRNADIAMYKAKKSEKSVLQIYTTELGDEVERYEYINSSLKLSLKESAFYLVYMPIYHCQTRKIIGCEALLRSTLSELSHYGPDEFIPIAERSGVIKEIDYWVMEAAIKQLSLWMENINFDGVMSINFSSWQLKNQEFVPKVVELIKRYNVPPQRVELEITETCFVPGEYKNLEILTELHNIGVKLSLDDFGTGYTAFSQLIDYPINTLKIDKMFVDALEDSGNGKNGDRPLVDIMVDVAKLYNLNMVAEGIETEHQLRYVTKLGCQSAQGYLLSKPLTVERFVEQWESQELLFNDLEGQKSEHQRKLKSV